MLRCVRSRMCSSFTTSASCRDPEKLRAIGRLRFRESRKRLTVDELHRHQQHVAGVGDLENVDEERVIEGGAEADVADQRFAARRIFRQLARQDFDGDHLAAARVFRGPDSRPDPIDETVVQQRSARSDRIDRRHGPNYRGATCTRSAPASTVWPDVTKISSTVPSAGA